jgi:hypothetical protein
MVCAPQIRTRAALLNETTAKNISYLWPGNQTTLRVPAPTRAFKIDISQPLLNAVSALAAVSLHCCCTV